ncbi:GGDEF domain-containing protein [Candidatus Collierbacteria bacterium]|nr:GGDEF domain-containing protein [Candidatus Collierbacteria bacterium]
MPESVPDKESTPSPYISPEEDKDNAGRLKPDVAYQVHHDIRQEAKRQGLEVKPDDSPEEKERKNQALKQLFEERSDSDLSDYQATQIVDLEEKASRDSLTGLLNRREFGRLFSELLQQSNESDQPILFLMIDLDHFKKMNDTYGHRVGDQALQYLARTLTQSVEIGDLVARWGGEEFTIAVKPKSGQILDLDKLFIIAERIRGKTIDLLSRDKYQLTLGAPEETLPDKITLSVGATLTKSGDTLETVCQRADENLYIAKKSGRNQLFGDNGKIILTPSPGGPPETLPRSGISPTQLPVS